LTSGLQGIADTGRPWESSVPVEYNVFFFGVVVVAIVLSLLLFIKLSKSPFGRVLRAIREDEDVAMALGKNTFLFKLKSFGLGAAVAGLGGGLWGLYANAIDPSLFSAETTFLVWMAIIIGGTGSYIGAVVGTFIFMTFDYGVQFIPSSVPFSGELPHIRLIVFGVILIAIMAYRPYGLFGDKRRIEASEE
jgi:branched-chain amino acid transport system permease protein